MKSNPPKNLAASIRAKLLDRARDRKEDFQFMLGRWVAELFLFRLGKSDQREAYVLKGATLFLIWQGKLLRPTRDIDLLGYGSGEIREDAEYDGVRVRVPAMLDGAKVQLQIDIGSEMR